VFILVFGVSCMQSMPYTDELVVHIRSQDDAGISYPLLPGVTLHNFEVFKTSIFILSCIYIYKKYRCYLHQLRRNYVNRMSLFRRLTRNENLSRCLKTGVNLLLAAKRTVMCLPVIVYDSRLPCIFRFPPYCYLR
jgi:hypothetical protein